MELGCEANAPFAMFLPTIDRQRLRKRLPTIASFFSTLGSGIHFIIHCPRAWKRERPSICLHCPSCCSDQIPLQKHLKGVHHSMLQSLIGTCGDVRNLAGT